MAAHEGRMASLLATARSTAIDGLKIRYIDFGRRSGPDVLLLAAPPAGLDALEESDAPLVDTRRLVAIDPPGSGASEGRHELLIPAAMAGFLMKVIEAFRLRHPHLAASSELIPCALATAANYPGAVESLILRSKRSGQAPTPDALLARLPHVEAPVLVLTDTRDGAPDRSAALLYEGLPKCRLADAQDAPTCCGAALGGALVDSWIGGEYRALAAAPR